MEGAYDVVSSLLHGRNVDSPPESWENSTLWKESVSPLELEDRIRVTWA